MELNQVTLPSLDVKRSIAFYSGMGFELIVRALPEYARFLSQGDSTFSIHLVDSLPGPNGAVVYFETENVDEVVNGLIEQGYSFEKLPVDERWGWREAELLDPDGNRVIIYRAGEYRRNPPWRIS